MITNAQRFRFKADVTEEAKAEAIAAITQMDSVSFAVVGQDLGDPADGFTPSPRAASAASALPRSRRAAPTHVPAKSRADLQRPSPGLRSPTAPTTGLGEMSLIHQGRPDRRSAVLVEQRGLGDRARLRREGSRIGPIRLGHTEVIQPRHGYCVGLKDLNALEHYFADPVHAAGDRIFLPREI